MLTTHGYFGGVERVAMMLSRGLAAAGVEVRTALPRTDKAQGVKQWFADNGVPAEIAVPSVYDVGPKSAYIRELRRFVSTDDSDVVHTHYGGNFMALKDALAIRSSGRRRFVATVHHAEPLEDGWKRGMTLLCSALVDRIVVPTELLQDHLLRAGVPRNKLVVVHHGIEPPARFHDRHESRSALGLGSDEFVVGCVSRLMPSKRVGLLLSAVGILAKKGLKVSLIVAGEGPEREALERARSLMPTGTCRLLGRVPETGSVYAASDLFALPSVSEGFGLVFVEAAFYGVPSIGANATGVPYAIADGESGLLVPPDDVEKFAAAIERLMLDKELRLRLGANAQARAQTSFSVETMISRYLKVYGFSD
jgi:glycosyltransferase involved in cell wall biosynthesis